MNLLEFKKRLESIKNLPTLPLVIEHLGRALEDPGTDADRVAAIIGDDPAIMARIMKVVNSAFYLGDHPATSLQSAVVRLGFRAVSNIAMSAAVFSSFPPDAKTEFDRAGFWRHCICTGIAADAIQGGLPRFTHLDFGRDTLHLCGLLHDIGKIIFEQYFHDLFAQAIELSRNEQIPLCVAESRIIGIDHAQAGAWLGRKWNLSEPVLEVIRWHHKPQNATPAHRDLVALCHLADMAACGSPSESADMASLWEAQRIGPEEKAWSEIMERIKDEAEGSALLMSFLQQ